MPGKRYKVTLEPDERRDLEKLISRGKGAARRLAHARILLHADQGEGRPGKIDAEIAEAVGVSVATIERVRQRFVEEGLETALSPRPPRRLYPRELDGKARLIALACSPPPEGRAPCGCWPSAWWFWAMSRRCPTRRCGRRYSKPTQTAFEKDVVHSADGQR